MSGLVVPLTRTVPSGIQDLSTHRSILFMIRSSRTSTAWLTFCPFAALVSKYGTLHGRKYWLETQNNRPLLPVTKQHKPEPGLEGKNRSWSSHILLLKVFKMFYKINFHCNICVLVKVCLAGYFAHVHKYLLFEEDQISLTFSCTDIGKQCSHCLLDKHSRERFMYRWIKT